MDISTLRNPYDYRNPVRDQAIFAGRTDELAVIAYELDQAAADHPSVCVVLHGPRASGKTSLLNATEQMASKRGFITTRVELIEGDEKPTVFFRKVYEELVSALAAAASGATKMPCNVTGVRRVMARAAEGESVAPLEFPEAIALADSTEHVPEAALRADLSYFVRLFEQPIVLLIDEAQLIANDPKALSVLRFLAARVNGLVLVLAGTSGLVEQITKVHSPILRQFREIEVRGFVEVEDVRNCILRPLLSIGIDGKVSRDVVSSMIQLTDGNPYEIQLYCHEMFARWQRGLADGLILAPDVLEGIRSRMESGRADVLNRPLIRAVRRMSPFELIAFNVLTSSLGHATAEEAWFAYRMTGRQEITRTQYDQCREMLIKDGILASDEIIHFAIDSELFDEIYVRLWTAREIGQEPHTQFTSRNNVRSLLIDRLFNLLHGFAKKPLRIFPTCCFRMTRSRVDEIFKALETLPAAGPDATPRVHLLHSAILQAGEPSALDLTAITCTYGRNSVERWLYSADTENIELAEHPEFIAAADRIAHLGGNLSAAKVRVPLRSWPAHEWFEKSTGQLRSRLAENHLAAAYDAYTVGDSSATLSNLQLSFTLNPGWEQANNLTYINLASGRPDEALEWADRAVSLAPIPWTRSLSLYNNALAQLLVGNRDASAALLGQAAKELDTRVVDDPIIEFLLLPAPDDVALLHEETGVSLKEAVVRVRAALSSDSVAANITEDIEPEKEHEHSKQEASADDLRDPSRAPIVLFVATEWASLHGGLSTFNRDLCRATAAAGAQVFCVVLSASPEELTAAADAGITLLPAPKMPGASEDMRLTSRPKLPDGGVPDLVVGHSRITGPAAKKLTDDFFPSARRLHFLHMAPDEIEWYKLDRESDAGLRAEERTDIERALGRSAHRVVTVGPRLHDQFMAEFANPLRLDPGFDAAVTAVERKPPGGSPLRVLLLGRVEDAQLKGVDLAAAACGQVAAWRQEDGLSRIRLVVRGTPEATSEEERARIGAWAASPLLHLVVREYTSTQDRIDNDLNSASLVIMPSRSEGFGLVGAEAISLGIPVLASSESGLAQLLREVLGRESADNFVVSISGNDEKDTDKWARNIDRKLRDLPAAFQQASNLRANLAEHAPWSKAAAAILGEIGEK
ncbi:BREX system ATP-binding domain-containing protein [Kitasatospora terrestris]|uniref:Orc1-like AAA ATPase domain-containing protein n=1 Tax=Kitasatospora terrestris TaxID=258051 RepID=A0ABP9E7N2_9ACTN